MLSINRFLGSFVNKFQQCATKMMVPATISRNFSMFQSPRNIENSTFINTPAIANKYLLNPVNLIVNQIAGFKVKGHLKRRCKDCHFILRQRRMYVICKTHPRHKQMAMRKSDDKFWILTHATQSKFRPY